MMPLDELNVNPPTIDETSSVLRNEVVSDLLPLSHCYRPELTSSDKVMDGLIQGTL